MISSVIAMEQVKKRDFILKFSEYEDKEVKIIGKNGKVLGIYLGGEFVSRDNVNKGDAIVNKKEIADKIVEEIYEKARNNPGIRPQPFITTERNKKMFQDAGMMSKDSTDNAVEYSDEDTHAEVHARAMGLDIVGTCDICHTPSKELWEHEEEPGQELKVCQRCFSNSGRFKTHRDLEHFLLCKNKVGETFPEDIPVVGLQRMELKPPAKFVGFNPIPKPLKKIKK